MMRFLPSRLEQERFTKMNRNSANTCLTNMINISIESYKLPLNEIIQIKNKNSFIIIIINKDAFLSKGTSNEETASQDQQLHHCKTDSENSLLVNNSNISLLFPPDTFMVIMFAGALRQALAYCVHLNAELFSCAEVTCARCYSRQDSLVLFPPAQHIDGCLKYKNKEKPKTGLRPGPRLNYDVKIGPKPGPRDVKKSGPVGPGLKCRALLQLLIWNINTLHPNNANGLDSCTSVSVHRCRLSSSARVLWSGMTLECLWTPKDAGLTEAFL